MAGSPASLKPSLVCLQVTTGEQGLLIVLLINPGRPSAFSLPWQKAGFSPQCAMLTSETTYRCSSTPLKSLASLHLTLLLTADLATVLETAKPHPGVICFL